MIQLHRGHRIRRPGLQLFSYRLLVSQLPFRLVKPLSHGGLSLAILLSYLKSVKWANRLTVLHTTMTVIGSLALLISWAISVGLFKFHDHEIENGDPDLWSWACAQRSAAHPAVDWEQVCIEQVHPMSINLTCRIGALFAAILA
jgi:hypothetical protein